MVLERADEIARSLGLNELRLCTNARFAANIVLHARL